MGSLIGLCNGNLLLGACPVQFEVETLTRNATVQNGEPRAHSSCILTGIIIYRLGLHIGIGIGGNHIILIIFTLGVVTSAPKPWVTCSGVVEHIVHIYFDSSLVSSVDQLHKIILRAIKGIQPCIVRHIITVIGVGRMRRGQP